MHQTGIEKYFVCQNQKKLRYGYTTGSCAAAAAKAAAWMLITGERLEHVNLMTPKGIALELPLEDIHIEDEEVSCAVRKDGGDDPDATHGLLIYAAVRRNELKQADVAQHRNHQMVEHQNGWDAGMHCFLSANEYRVLCLDGGRGVGRVTKQGLEQPVGAAAINRVPRKMIFEELEKVCEKTGYAGGLQIMISVPGGEETAQKTFNPRLGIEGGISILGTSGIVVPMSEAALIASIRLEMEMKRAAGAEYLLITPGNYGETFLKQQYAKLDVEQSMKCSNYVGETLDMAVELGFKGILFVSHIGKFVKVAGGIMNTHSRHSDARAELMCSLAILAGADLDTAKRILHTLTTEEAAEILEEKRILSETVALMAEKVKYYLQHRCGGVLQTEAILFSNNKGYLGETDGAEALLHKIIEKQVQI